jgi:hypothetical protein
MNLGSPNEAASTAACSVWVDNTLSLLQEGLPCPDMLWVLEDGRTLPDSRAIYAKCGPVLKNMVDCEGTNPPLLVHASGYLADPSLLRMVRTFCHTGIVLYGRKDTPQELLKRFQCCDTYELISARAVLQNIIVDRLDIHTALATFNAVAFKEFSDASLCTDIDTFIKRYTCEVLSRPSLKLSHLSLEAVPHLCEVMSSDDINITELKLLECLFSICCRRNKGGRTSTELFMQCTEQSMSLWGCIRIYGLTIDSVLAFNEAHPHAFEDAFVITLCNCIRKKAVTEQEMGALHLLPTSLLPPRTMKAMSCYPRHLNLPADAMDSKSFVMTTFQGDREGVSYACVRYTKKGEVTVPPLKCFDSILQMNVMFHGHLSIAGGLDLNCSVRKISDCEEPKTHSQLQLVVYIINFKHQKWNNQGVLITKGKEFFLDRVISTATLDNSGYRFNPSHYPDYEPGQHIMLKIETYLQGAEAEAPANSADTEDMVVER